MADSEIPASEPHSADETPATPRVPAGQLLREARTRAGLTVASIATDLRVSSALIEAIEAGDYSKFAGAPYVRAMMVSISHRLRIDSKEVLLAYGAETGAEPTPVAAVSPYKDDSKTHARAHKQIFILLLAVLLFVLLLIMGKVNSSSPDDEASSAAPAQSDTLLNVDPIGDADSLALDSLGLDSAGSDSLSAAKDSVASPKPAKTLTPATKPVAAAAVTAPVSTETSAAEPAKEASAAKEPTAVQVRALGDTVFVRILRAGRRESSRTLPPGQTIDVQHNDVIVFITRTSNSVEVTAGGTVVIPDKRRFKVAGTSITY
jgi:cytoskeleton protein RodZ